MCITSCRAISTAGRGHENLTLLCSGHHRALHEGHLIITGRAPNLDVVWKNGVVGPDAADVDATADDDVPVDAAVDARHPIETDDKLQISSITDYVSKPHVGPDLCRSPVDHDAAPRLTPQPSNYEWTVKKTEVIAALKQMGFAKDEARALVEQAAAELQRTASREDLMRRALRIYRKSPAGASLSR